MKTSESIEKIALALANFQKKVESPKKSSDNPAFKRDGKSLKYADLDAIIKVITPALSENGLSQMQFTSSNIEAKTVTVSTMILHSSGQYMISDDLVLPAENFGKFNAQTIGSSITYGRRYSLSAMLGIASEDDDDANAQSQQDNKKPYKQQSKPQQQSQQQPPERDSYEIREEELLAELENKMQLVANKVGIQVGELQKFVVDNVNKTKGSAYTHIRQVDKGLAIGTLKTVEMKFDEKRAQREKTEQGSMLESMTNKPTKEIEWGAK